MTVELVSHELCGRTVRVARDFAAKLAQGETRLKAAYAARPAADAQLTYSKFHGVKGAVGWRNGKPSAPHPRGHAIDLNYATSGYGAVESTVRGRIVLGGEGAARRLGIATAVRVPYTAAVRRACEAAGVAYDLSAGRRDELPSSVWDRHHRASEAVRKYLAPYFPDQDAYDIGADDLKPGVTLADVPAQVLEDYQALRVVLVAGKVELHPNITRNPAKGLFEINRCVIEAFCDAGPKLRWGGGFFGAEETGDYMHLDDSTWYFV